MSKSVLDFQRISRVDRWNYIKPKINMEEQLEMAILNDLHNKKNWIIAS